MIELPPDAEDLTGRYGVGSREFGLLAAVASEPDGVTAFALGNEVHVAAGRIAQLFERLAIDALVSFTRGRDAGRCHARITPAGVQTLGLAAAAVLAAAPGFTTPLPAATVSELESLVATAAA